MFRPLAVAFFFGTMIVYFCRRHHSHPQQAEKQRGDSFLFLSSLQCDAVSVLEKEHDYRDEHFDFIQSHLRRFCLQCILGALCQGTGAQAPFCANSGFPLDWYLQKDKELPESRTVFCQGKIVYIFLLVLYFTVLEFETY